MSKKNTHNLNSIMEELYKRCNYMDKESIKVVYLALIKLIIDSLKTKGGITLPLFGRFRMLRLREMPWKDRPNWAARSYTKFRACTAMSEYLKDAFVAEKIKKKPRSEWNFSKKKEEVSDSEDLNSVVNRSFLI